MLLHRVWSKVATQAFTGEWVEYGWVGWNLQEHLSTRQSWWAKNNLNDFHSLFMQPAGPQKKSPLPLLHAVFSRLGCHCHRRRRQGLLSVVSDSHWRDVTWPGLEGGREEVVARLGWRKRQSKGKISGDDTEEKLAALQSMWTKGQWEWWEWAVTVLMSWCIVNHHPHKSGWNWIWRTAKY